MTDKSTNYVVIEQYASHIGRPKSHRQTLIGLKLNRIGKRAKLLDTPALRGMLAKVSHLVRIVQARR